METNPTSTSVRDYARAVWREWKVLVSGGAGIAILLQAAEHISGKNISWQWYVGLLACLVIWACYRAWRGERERYLEAQRQFSAIQLELSNTQSELAEEKKRRTPDLRGKIINSSVGKADIGVCVTLFAEIRNRGADSIVHSYKMSIDLPIGGRAVVTPTHMEGTATLMVGPNNAQGVAFHSNDLLYVKTAVNPIKNGTFAEGPIIFVLNGVTWDEVEGARESIILSFMDIEDRIYDTPPHGPSTAGLPYMPSAPIKIIEATQGKKRETKPHHRKRK
jgi:hypothetical protein